MNLPFWDVLARLTQSKVDTLLVKGIEEIKMSRSLQYTKLINLTNKGK